MPELTTDELERYRRMFAKNPAWAKYRDMVVARAEEEGGVALEFLRNFYGYFWDEPRRLSLAECSEKLQLPVSDLVQIGDAIVPAVFRAWRETPESRAWRPA